MHILVPVDRSEPAENALEFATDHYGEATITALHVVNPPEVLLRSQGTASSLEEHIELRKDGAESLFEDLETIAAERGVGIETEVVVGETEQAIFEYAEENDVDMIVMGSHGRTGWSRITLGSVAEKIVRRSPVPVTVVR